MNHTVEQMLQWLSAAAPLVRARLVATQAVIRHAQTVLARTER